MNEKLSSSSSFGKVKLILRYLLPELLTERMMLYPCTGSANKIIDIRKIDPCKIQIFS